MPAKSSHPNVIRKLSESAARIGDRDEIEFAIVLSAGIEVRLTGKPKLRLHADLRKPGSAE
jgi:hypothetical protein